MLTVPAAAFCGGHEFQKGLESRIENRGPVLAGSALMVQVIEEWRRARQ